MHFRHLFPSVHISVLSLITCRVDTRNTEDVDTLITHNSGYAFSSDPVYWMIIKWRSEEKEKVHPGMRCQFLYIRLYQKMSHTLVNPTLSWCQKIVAYPGVPVMLGFSPSPAFHSWEQPHYYMGQTDQSLTVPMAKSMHTECTLARSHSRKAPVCLL